MAPDSATFTASGIVTIKDPDNVVLTSTWVTNALDADDSSDVYDASHPHYKGALASPANTGLFHDGSGHLAVKVLIPIGTELTAESSTRSHSITWTGIIVNGVTIPPTSETFKVSEAGTLVFGSTVITVAEVEAGIVTSLTDDEIELLIEEAADWATGRLELADIDTTAFTSLPPTVKTAIILYTRALIFERDASAGRRMTRIEEGTKRAYIALQSTKDLETLRLRALEELTVYMRRHGYRKRIRITRVDRVGEDGESALR